MAIVKKIGSPVDSAFNVARWASAFEATDLVVSTPNVASNGTEASRSSVTSPLGAAISVWSVRRPVLDVSSWSRSCWADPAVIWRAASGSSTGHQPDHFEGPWANVTSTPPRV